MVGVVVGACQRSRCPPLGPRLDPGAVAAHAMSTPFPLPHTPCHGTHTHTRPLPPQPCLYTRHGNKLASKVLLRGTRKTRSVRGSHFGPISKCWFLLGNPQVVGEAWGCAALKWGHWRSSFSFFFFFFSGRQWSDRH